VFADRGRARPADHGHYSDFWADPQHEDTAIAILEDPVRAS
jgi:arabinogalactan endo-1,4-beta-galactosidase